MAEIRVNGRPYELATFDTLTLDEAMIVWDYAKLTLDQLPELEGFHPGLVASLIHISVARVERDESARSIRRVVGQLKVADLEQIFDDISEEIDEQADPPPSVPPAASRSGSGDASSLTGVPHRAVSPANGSGNQPSDISAISDPPILAR